MNNLIEEIRHEQMLTAERLVIRNLERLELSKPVKVLAAVPKTRSSIMDLCDLAKPYLIDGQRLFASKSIVVAVNDSQPLADRLADINLTVRLLTTLGDQLAKDAQ